MKIRNLMLLVIITVGIDYFMAFCTNSPHPISVFTTAILWLLCSIVTVYIAMLMIGNSLTKESTPEAAKNEAMEFAEWLTDINDCGKEVEWDYVTRKWNWLYSTKSSITTEELYQLWKNEPEQEDGE
jgi:hypothetical protein